MENKKEMTTPNVSAATDTEQPFPKCTEHSIADCDENIKSFEEMQREMLRQLSPSYLKTVSMAALYDTVFDIQTPLIDGLLQRGTYLFVGSPKVGKSFMMAQLAYHISTGTPLWDYKVRKATVLYFALEDDYPRLQKRLFQMFGAEEAGDLYFATESKTVNGGLEEQIRGFMQEHPDTGLIIIDTLKRVREAGGADYSYASDYDIVARLKALADSYKVTMLIVHHTRKQKAEDIFDMISGTNGLMGAADGAFVLSKEKRTSNNAKEVTRMTFAEKLKSIRKKAGLSQEQLAEKLGVSRQAVTKWETETGIPDIENMMAISALFDISIDELLSNERGMKKSDEYLFESVTEYDIDEPKRYDMKFGGAKQFVLSGYEGEKIRVRLVSNTLSTLQNDFKVKIDDIRKRIDVDVIRKNGISEATAKETVSIFVQIPMSYVGKIEGAVNAETVEIRSLDCDSIELDVKTPNIILNDVGGTVEINCNLDMSVVCNSLKGYLAINQVSAASKIHIPEGEVFTAVTKGIGTSISYEKDGRQTERFDTPDAENVIELNGIKSELVICND